MPEPVTSVFNDAYIAETYEFWLRDPNSVEESWRQFFTLAHRYGQGAVWSTPLVATQIGRAHV